MVDVKVANLQIPINPKHVPLTIPHIEVGVEVIIINIALHASKVFRTLEVVMKNTFVVNEPQLKPSIIVEFVDVLDEKNVDNLVAFVEHVAIGD